MNFKGIYYDLINEYDTWFSGYDERGFVDDINSCINGKIAFFNMLPEGIESGPISYCLCMYYCKDSKYYKCERLLDATLKCIKALRSKLNDDGTNNLYISNFHTGEQFGLFGLGEILDVMQRHLGSNKKELEVYDALVELVEFEAIGCLNSGFHTPNHRWVESAGLLLAYRCLKNTNRNSRCEEILNKAKKYLNEGVDCDEYGEWSERSAGMYNIHCDNAFLSIYDVLGCDEYLDCVYRNIMLMRYYINASDLALFTQNSRRKDKGEVGSVQLFNKGHTFYAEGYLKAYNNVAFLKKDNLLASMAIYLENKVKRQNRPIPICGFHIYLNHPEILDWEFEYVDPFPKTYENYLPDSNIVRKKTDLATFSFLANNPSFLQIEARNLIMDVRLCSSFFAIAQFIPETMEKTENGYKMTMIAEADYKLPLENPDGISTKKYWTIDYSKRGSIQKQTLEMSAELDFVSNDVFDLKISVLGCEKVPTKLEMFFNEGLHIEIGDAVIVTNKGGNVYSRGEKVRVECSEGIIMEIENLFCKHLYTTDMRGSLDPIPNMFVLEATTFSPFEKTIRFKLSKSKSRRIFY